MAKFHIFQSEGAPFNPAPPEAGKEDLGSPGATRIRHPGSAAELQLFEVTSRPNLEVPVHAHKEDEIIYIVSGELRLGGRTLVAGDSAFIAGMTLYSFDAGPEGVRFLNFRGRQDYTYFTADEYREFKKLDPQAQAEASALNSVRRKAQVGMD